MYQEPRISSARQCNRETQFYVSRQIVARHDEAFYDLNSSRLCKSGWRRAKENRDAAFSAIGEARPGRCRCQQEGAPRSFGCRLSEGRRRRWMAEGKGKGLLRKIARGASACVCVRATFSTLLIYVCTRVPISLQI